MTQVPESITVRLREIEGNLSSARQIQQMEATQVARLDQQIAELKGSIAGRRRAIRDWKLQRDALRYAVDAIDGSVVDAGTVEAPTTEPFVERVVVRPSPKEVVYETIKRMGPAHPARITEEAGLCPRAVASVLGTLKKQGKAIRTEEGLWGPAHQ